jgi:DNA-directed RNA polymerase specialized sigma24 family protein
MEHFATTRWSLVLEAGAELTPRGRAALATLCELYWYPLYSYLRRRGKTAEDAQDLTQGFFARLLEKQTLQVADRARGRFRSFLLASLDHYVSNERDHAQAQKRGGSTPPISLDLAMAEDCYIREPADPWTPEKIFDRNWALALLGRVLSRLRRELHDDGKGPLFDALQGYLSGDEAPASYQQVGKSLNMTDGALRVVVHRLRRRYRTLLYDEIAQTVGTPEEIDLELHYLIDAIKA